jgi:O-antigen/teichoic acid export membrane protein
LGIIQKQGIQNTIITYLGIIIGFVNLILIQPFLLSKEEIGLMRMLLSFSSLLAVFIPLGITSITVRYFPIFRNHEKGHYGFLGFVILFPVAGGILIFFLLHIFKGLIIGQYEVHSKLFTEYYNYILPFSVILGFITVLNTYCFSLFKTTLPSLLNLVLNRILTIVVIVIYFLKWINIDQFIFLFILIYGIQLLILVYYLFKIDKPTLKVDRAFMKEQKVLSMIKYGFLLSIAGIASLGLKYLDSIMIGNYMSLGFVGIYSIAAFIPTFIEAPLNSLDTIAYTKLANAISSDNHKEIKEIYFKSSKYLFLLGGALFLLVNINIADLFTFLPPEFGQGVNVVLIISIGTLINMAGGSNTSLIYNSKFYKLGGLLLILMAAMAFGLNIILIPDWGIEGAAVSTAVTVSFFAILRFVIIYKGFELQPYDRSMLYILLLVITGMILHLILPATSSPVFNIFYRSIIILGMYVYGTYFLRIVPEFHKYIPWKKNIE